MDAHQRKRPIMALGWQLDLLKKLQSNSPKPTEEQRSAAAAETGLDEKWVRDWFSRQRGKPSRPKRRKRATSPSPASYSTVPVYRLQVDPPQDQTSTPTTPADSPAGLEHRTPRPNMPRSIPSPRRSASLDEPSQDPVPPPTPAYSRDPLCNRYPDFSQFFHPEVHERFPASALPIPVSSYSDFFQSLRNRHVGSYALFNPSTHTPYVGSPVSFHMRLVDLLVYP